MTEEPTPEQIAMMDEQEQLEAAAEARRLNDLLRTSKGDFGRYGITVFSEGFKSVPPRYKQPILAAIREGDISLVDLMQRNDYGRLIYTCQGGPSFAVSWKIDVYAAGKDGRMDTTSEPAPGQKHFRCMTIFLDGELSL